MLVAKLLSEGQLSSAFNLRVVSALRECMLSVGYACYIKPPLTYLTSGTAVLV